MPNYKTVTGLLRYGMKLPDVAKRVAKEIKARKLKLKNDVYYRIYFYNPESKNWFYSDPEWTLKSAKDKLKRYNLSHDLCHLVKITETKEIICLSKSKIKI